MNPSIKALRDDAARREAITSHHRSLLVEAGAGSGKTAVMAGRIAMMMAQGIAPGAIAAVTFTELAASELLLRVREFVSELTAGNVPPELRVALPDGLSSRQRADLAAGSVGIDEITCSTIHGFCQRLIKPYPVEADIDPGAGVMDRNQGDLAFLEIVDAWLRERLSGVEGGIIAEMVLHDPGQTVALIHKILKKLRQRRTVSTQEAPLLKPDISAFLAAVVAFAGFIRNAPAVEEGTAGIAGMFEAMAQEVGDAQVAEAAGPSRTAGTAVESPAFLIRLLVNPVQPGLCRQDGPFYAFEKKGAWRDTAKRAGLSKADGERLFAEALHHYTACCRSWHAMLRNVASHVLSQLIDQVQPVLHRFRTHKRATALLDFDDLIFAARDLLRDHAEVRRALAARYAHVLVDEFQDTDPIQTEIFWRLCGDSPLQAEPLDWSELRIRPGALFLVGDPKQAIYRFRGADVTAYVRARTAFRAQDPKSVLSISTNFRSCAPILSYINERFEPLLSASGQPGYTPLDAFHPDRGEALCVAALDVAVTVANPNKKATTEEQRDAEADAVGDLCARLIGNEMILDRRSGLTRKCLPGDIALLAPTGTDLWRYEEALERHGIPVATQAGKGLYRRQEIQDLIALTRVLADRRDTLALGALLRGPLVGLTEEQLLDIVWSLPRSEQDPSALPRLSLDVDVMLLANPLAREIFGKLQSLRKRINGTTPHDLLSQAVDVLRVRPILLQRHGGQAERALANVDLYLSLSTAFAVRGIRAFAEAMTAAWTDESRAVEGRPDAQEDSVALYTMHAAKGLEWPIVVPINTMTSVTASETAVIDRDSECFYCPVFKVEPIGYAEARDAEKAELEHERIRLWYVAATRARELLVLPRLDALASKSTWIGLLDLTLDDLPALELSHLAHDISAATAAPPNSQTREIFGREAATIADRHRRLLWLAPSRDENRAAPLLQAEGTELLGSDESAGYSVAEMPPLVQGGLSRGRVMHKLLEEVLTGETAADVVALTGRAAELIIAIGETVMDHPAKGLCPPELARCVERALALPDVVGLRPTLVAEYPVFAFVKDGSLELASAGVADAASLGADGNPRVIIDWKSDVQPSAAAIAHYRAQVRNYLDMTGAERGLIVMLTSGTVLTVSPSPVVASATAQEDAA